MAVTWPEAGQHRRRRVHDGRRRRARTPTCFEYRETAPAAAKVDLFADGKVTWLDHKAAGVPGTVRGLALAHKKFGKLPWKDVVMPAVKLAEDGLRRQRGARDGLNSVLADPKTTNAEFKRVYGKPDGDEVEGRRHARAEGPRPHAAADRREGRGRVLHRRTRRNCSRRR